MKPRRVNFHDNRNDLSVLLLAECGLHAFTIAEQTGMSVSQVSYRYRKAGISLKDYRNGLSWVSKMLIRGVKIQDPMMDKLRQDILNRVS